MANATLGRLMAAISPRNDNYFVLFNSLANCVVRGSKVLAMMSAVKDSTKFDEHFAELRKIESEADEYTKEILLSLHKTFITPFDRREIRELAMAVGLTAPSLHVTTITNFTFCKETTTPLTASIDHTQ